MDGRILFAAFGLIVAGYLSSCSQQREHILFVACLADRQDIEEMRDLFGTISREDGMRLVDASKASETSARRTNDLAGTNLRTDETINLALYGRNGAALAVTNGTNDDYRVLIDVHARADKGEARALADSVVEQLRERWPVLSVPEGGGLGPINDCPGHSLREAT